MSDKFRTWMDYATPRQKARLAQLANTSVNTLYIIKGAYRTDGRVSTSPELARRIELAMAQMVEEGKSHFLLPVVRREDLCAACSGCEYAKEAAKGRV